MNMIFERKLAIPQEVKQMYPTTPEIQAAVEERTNTLKEIFAGKNDKFILIIGPCSADRDEAYLCNRHLLFWACWCKYEEQ